MDRRELRRPNPRRPEPGQAADPGAMLARDVVWVILPLLVAAGGIVLIVVGGALATALGVVIVALAGLALSANRFVRRSPRPPPDR
jgi:hypothetical protein